ncbi:MAG TPA: hypothetical protein VMY38_06085 [Gemmatimonadaceae bacterium]|nr:hypothetical protein [Gemmatimonadaceae bacterium]
MQAHRLTAPVLAFASLHIALSIPASAQSPGTTRSNDRAEAMASAATPIRWEASLRPTLQRSGRLAATARNKTTGTVFMSQAGQDRVRVRLTVATSYHDGSDLKWAIVPGRCGSNMMPIAPVEQFPTIEVSANGRGEMDRVLPVTLPASGQYHVNVYRGGFGYLENVLTCGNLSRSN